MKEKVKSFRAVDSNNRSVVTPSPMYASSLKDRTPDRSSIVSSKMNTQFKVPQPSPATPLTSRTRNRVQMRTLDYEDLLTKGNVENVPGSPAELQSKKTGDKIKALEKASMKLSYWNP